MSEPTLPAGTIHDLGYKRYAGTRQSTGTRWRVIMRHQIASSWQSWWRYKWLLGLAVIVTMVTGGMMFMLQDREVNGIRLLQGMAARMMDDALPRAIAWYSRIAFLVGLTIGARVVASDRQSGAFTFYFARSVRLRDYVIGKAMGMFMLVGLVMIAGPLLLAITRLALCESLDQLIAMLPILPKALAVGLLGTLAFAAVPLAFSALIRSPRLAMALWVTFYLIGGVIVYKLSAVLKNGVGALDLDTALDAVAFDLFDMTITKGRAKRVELGPALASLLIHASVALSIVVWQVRRAHGRGIGGAS